jgi:inorganic pyrophosphatase
MTSENKINVFIEIEQYSNQKFEFDKKSQTLELDRVLPYPYFYPYCYGFIPNTLAQDGDELDALIITNKSLKNNEHHTAYIIGVLIMEDEKGMDEKILAVLEEDYKIITDIDCLNEHAKENLKWFFSNYKNSTANKWSKVHSIENRDTAVELYKKYLFNNNV